MSPTDVYVRLPTDHLHADRCSGFVEALVIMFGRLIMRLAIALTTLSVLAKIRQRCLFG
jgi:hypothetical protein